MNINNLKVGQIIKNYKEMCEILQIPIKTGGAKQKQMEWLQQYLDFHKQGNKIIIDKIFNKNIESIKDHRGGSHNTVNYPNFRIQNQYWKSRGVYSIKLNNNIYIGSTVVGFRNRFLQHNSKSNTLSTYDMLQQGAIFEILWLDNTNDEPFIRQMENKYINYYRNKTEWNVVNEKDSWSYTQPKIQYKSVRINKNKLNEVIELLEQNNIEYKI